MALENADKVQSAIVEQLKLAVPADWKVFNRKDTSFLISDEMDRVAYVTNKPDVTLEVESDNRELVGYPIPITLILKEMIQERDGKDLIALRRRCKQFLYTTAYDALTTAGLTVEWIDIGEEHGEHIAGLEEGYTTAELLVTVGLIEDRSLLS